MKSLKITSGCEPFGVRVFDPETGANMNQSITDITIYLRPGERPTAVIELMVDVEIEVNVDDIEWQATVMK